VSKIIATEAIEGAHAIVAKAEAKLREAIDSKGPNEPVAFPNTGYFLPVIYGFTGRKVTKLSDLEPVIALSKELLPIVPAERRWLPYLGETLDAGVSTLFAEETIEALKYVIGPNPVDGIYLGAADDVIMRQRGVEFVDGTAPGFAAVVGTAPTNEQAVKLAREMQEKSLYVFIAGSDPQGRTFADQLSEEGVELGWDTRLVPFGRDVYAHIYSLGFATRAALAFGGVAPGDYRKLLRYNKNRVFAFVVALNHVDREKYATAAGAISYGFPTIAETNIPQILPRGVTTYEHVVSGVPVDEIVAKAIEVRGLKIVITKVPIPVSYGPAFEGERVRKANLRAEFGGKRSVCFEYLRMREMNEVEDGKITVHGPDIDDIPEGGALPLGIVVEVAGRKMQKDFEPVIERKIHDLINGAEGVQHNGQRDIAWIRISKAAVQKGFKTRHIGDILYAKLKGDFAAIIDKLQVNLYTTQDKVDEMVAVARQAYHERNIRVANLTDETVDLFYSCTLCQSFAPNHVCIVSPQRLGLCGSVNWLDAKASFEINAVGPNQPVAKGNSIDDVKGEFDLVNDFVNRKSNGTVPRVTMYSIMDAPMTACGCFECIVMLVPEANGVMVVSREDTSMTPAGMTFSTMAGTAGGGLQTPGMMGVGKFYLTSDKFMSAEGGLKRVVWMSSNLKETMEEELRLVSEKLGEPDLLDKIADERVATTVEEMLPFLEEKGHPALTMDPIF
jgi:acetyl-CoA synthase